MAKVFSGFTAPGLLNQNSSDSQTYFPKTIFVYLGHGIDRSSARTFVSLKNSRVLGGWAGGWGIDRAPSLFEPKKSDVSSFGHTLFHSKSSERPSVFCNRISWHVPRATNFFAGVNRVNGVFSYYGLLLHRVSPPPYVNRAYVRNLSHRSYRSRHRSYRSRYRSYTRHRSYISYRSRLRSYVSYTSYKSYKSYICREDMVLGDHMPRR